MKVDDDDHGQNGCEPRRTLLFLRHEYHTLQRKKIARKTLHQAGSACLEYGKEVLLSLTHYLSIHIIPTCLVSLTRKILSRRGYSPPMAWISPQSSRYSKKLYLHTLAPRFPSNFVMNIPHFSIMHKKETENVYNFSRKCPPPAVIILSSLTMNNSSSFIS